MVSAGVVLATTRILSGKKYIMSKRKWLLTALLALPLAAAGVAYGRALVRVEHGQETAGYVCPLTGEELPCPNCCPLNEK